MIGDLIKSMIGPIISPLIDRIPDPEVNDINIEMEALMRNVIEHSEKILALRGEMNNDVGAILESVNDPGKLADLVASNLKLKIDESQILLELIDPIERLKKDGNPEHYKISVAEDNIAFIISSTDYQTPILTGREITVRNMLKNKYADL